MTFGRWVLVIALFALMLSAAGNNRHTDYAIFATGAFIILAMGSGPKKKE